MDLRLKRNATAIAVLATAAFAGGAYAATQGSQTSPRQAFLDDAAHRLHVTPQQLTDALRGAFLDRLDAAVAAGKLTKAQADQIKQHVRSGRLGLGLGAPRLGLHGFEHGLALRPPGFGPGGPGPAGPGPGLAGPGPGLAGPGPGPGGRLKAAASYLGLAPQKLFDQLLSGRSLAQLAQAHGKSVRGLKAAMLAAIHARLDRAVAAKEITAAQEQKLLSELPARLDKPINRAGLIMGGRRVFHGRLRFPLLPPPGPAGLAVPPSGAP